MKHFNFITFSLKNYPLNSIIMKEMLCKMQNFLFYCTVWSDIRKENPCYQTKEHLLDTSRCIKQNISNRNNKGASYPERRKSVELR